MINTLVVESEYSFARPQHHCNGHCVPQAGAPAALSHRIDEKAQHQYPSKVYGPKVGGGLLP